MTAYKLLIIILLSFLAVTGSGMLLGQDQNDKKLYSDLYSARADTIKIMAMYSLYLYHSKKANDSALYYAKRAYSLSKENNDYELGRLAMALGHAYSLGGEYDKSLEFLTEAYEIAKRLNYEQIYAVLLNDIGLNLYYVKDYKRAEQYFYDALKVATTYDGRFLSYFYLAQIKAELGKFEEALDKYQHVLELTDAEKNNEDKAAVYNGLGDLYYDKQDYKTGIDFYEKSLLLFDSSVIYYKVTSHSGIAEGCLNTGEYEKALEHCLLTDSLANLGGFSYERASNYEALSEVYEKMGKKDLALKYYKDYTALNDSLLNEEKNKRISYLHVEFETMQKELQLKIVEKDISLKNRMLLLYILLSCIVFGAFTIGLIIYRSKNTRLELERQKAIRQVTEKATRMAHTMEFLTKLKASISRLDNAQSSDKKGLNTIVKEIQLFENQNVWDEFEHYFTKVHPDFFMRLKRKYPTLTINELRLCAMLKLALNTKEIATICGKTPKSIDVMRTRIRNKMNLDRPEKIYDVLLGM